MNARQLGTFNTIAQNRVQIGGDFPVWSRVDKVYQGGGYLDLTKFKPGDVIHAGTMVKFNGAGKQVEVITAEEVAGVKEVVTLTVKKGCATNGDLILVLNGKSVEVPLSTTQNAADLVATEIEKKKTELTEWDVKRTGATLIFTQKTAKETTTNAVYVNNTGADTEMEITAKGVTASGNLSDVNGLVFNDVCIPEGVTLATCAVVYAGRIYADRVFGGGIPSSVEAQLPMIEFVHEG